MEVVFNAQLPLNPDNSYNATLNGLELQFTETEEDIRFPTPGILDIIKEEDELDLE